MVSIQERFKLEGQSEAEGEQEKDRDDTHKYKTHRDPAAAAKFLQLCPTLRPHGQQPTRLPVHGFTGVGCHFLLHIETLLGHKYIPNQTHHVLPQTTSFSSLSHVVIIPQLLLCLQVAFHCTHLLSTSIIVSCAFSHYLRRTVP